MRCFKKACSEHQSLALISTFIQVFFVHNCLYIPNAKCAAQFSTKSLFLQNFKALNQKRDPCVNSLKSKNFLNYLKIHVMCSFKYRPTALITTIHSHATYTNDTNFQNMLRFLCVLSTTLGVFLLVKNFSPMKT